MTAPGNQGNTPAHYAAESGSVPTGLKGVEMDKMRNSSGYTPLFLAARAGKIQALRYLLKKECNYREVDSEGRSLIELTIGWVSHIATFLAWVCEAPHALLLGFS